MMTSLFLVEFTSSSKSLSVRMNPMGSGRSTFTLLTELILPHVCLSRTYTSSSIYIYTTNAQSTLSCWILNKSSRSLLLDFE